MTKEQIIENFYFCFANCNAEGMIAHYDENLIFEDPAFDKLSAEQAKNMWRMLCGSQKGKEFVVKLKSVKVEDNKGYAEWDAQYVFSKTNRRVHNRVKATFEFNGDLIIKHTDDFDLHSWAKQALGFKGALLGWTSFFKRRFNESTHELLAEYEANINSK